MNDWSHIHISLACKARFDMSNQSRLVLITAFRQMHFVSYPPLGHLPTIGRLCIVGGADHLRRGRNIVIGTEVDMALDQFKLLEPNLSQELYRWNMVQPVECWRGINRCQQVVAVCPYDFSDSGTLGALSWESMFLHPMVIASVPFLRGKRMQPRWRDDGKAI